MASNDLDGLNLEQRHGKDRVRVARVWRAPDGTHFMVEWNVSITLFSHCLNSYVHDDNSDIVATDTMKNTVKFPSLLLSSCRFFFLVSFSLM